MVIETSEPNPRHTFLSATDVMNRYGCRRTKGYELIASPGFPRDIAGRYRLDTLLAYEAVQLGLPSTIDEVDLCATDRVESASTVRAMIDTIEPDARHTFLTRTEVITRYGWGRTKGYRLIASEAFPHPVAGRFRLDALMAWEDVQLAGRAEPQSTEAAPEAAPSETVALPSRNRTRGVSRKVAA